MRKIFYSILLLLVIFITSEVNAQPLPPILSQPANNAINVSLFPTFVWQASTGATSYRLQIWLGSQVVFDQSGLTGTSYPLTQAVLVGNTAYYWRMNSTSSAGTGNWSGNFNFTTAIVIPNPPVLVAPANNSVNVSLTPLLDWQNSATATEYKVQVSTTITFNTTVLDVAGLANSGYNIQPGILVNSTLYYWRVNAKNAGGTSAWTEPWSFTTIIAAPLAPTLLLPLNNAINISVTPTFDWTDAVGASKYNIQIALNSNFTSLVYVDSAFVSTITLGPGILSGNQLYYWRVSAENIGGQSLWSTVFHFTTGTAPPAAPLLLLPTDGQTGVPITNVTFDWNTVAGANSYRIQVSTSSNFGTTFINQVVGSSQYTHYTPVFAYGTLYYWHVYATNSAGNSQWSQTWSFTTIVATPPAPVLIYPPNNAVDVPLTPTMDWTDVSGATSYRLQISTSSSFTSFVLNVESPQSQFSVPSGVLQGYTQYYWRVASINAGGTGSFSSSWTFRTVQTFNLNLKVFLEGFYNGTTQVQDTIKIYLAHATNFQFRDSSLALLDATGNANGVSFAKAASGYYWIVVMHRNHLETWSSILKNFVTGSLVTYDFTTSSSQAYGNNMKQVGTVWVFYGGDANQDGFVNGYDYDVYKPQFGLYGYRSCDFNGDSFVDGYDLPILNSNFGKNKIRPY